MPGSIVLNVRGGDRLHVPRNIDLMTPYVLLEQDDWFEDEIGFVRALLRPGQRAIDIGANHGIYSAAMARAVGRDGRVWIFEPTPQVAELLDASFGPQVPQLQLVRCALSDRKGTAHFRVGERSELNALQAQAASDTIAVRTDSLDHLAADLGWRDIDFVKIDAEGHEPRILEGGQAFFANQSPLVMYEMETEAAARLLLERFRALGYRNYRLVPGLRLLVPFADNEHLDSFQLNLFACKPDRARQLARDGLLEDGPDGRYGQLQAACEAAMREPPTLPGMMRMGRFARDLGARDVAVRCVTTARRMVEQDWHQVRDEGPPMPSERLDTLAAADLDAQRLDCALGEAYLELSCHSTFFPGVQILPAIESLDSNPYRCAATERRRQLVRMRGGLQAGPEPHALLTTRSDDNLNAEFWQNLS